MIEAALADPAFLPLVVLIAALGLVAGVIAGLFGIGGGIVLVPGLWYVFSGLGHDGPWLMQICLATSLATILVTSVRAVMLHRRRGSVDLSLLRGWAPAVALGALAGTALAARLDTQTLQVLFGLLGTAVGLQLALGRPDWHLAPAMPLGGRRLAVGGAMGLVSVLMGIGGGALAVLLMTLHRVPILRAVGTASGFGALIAVPSVAGFLTLRLPEAGHPPLTFGAVNLPAFALITAMTLATAPLGVALAHRLPAARLRPLFAAVLMLLSLNMLRLGVFGMG